MWTNLHEENIPKRSGRIYINKIMANQVKKFASIKSC